MATPHTYLERHVGVGGSVEVSVGPSGEVGLTERRTLPMVVERELRLGLEELRKLHFLNLTTNNQFGGSRRFCC